MTKWAVDWHLFWLLLSIVICSPHSDLCKSQKEETEVEVEAISHFSVEETAPPWAPYAAENPVLHFLNRAPQRSKCKISAPNGITAPFSASENLFVDKSLPNSRNSQGWEGLSHCPKVGKCFLISEFHYCHHYAGLSSRIFDHSEHRRQYL